MQDSFCETASWGASRDEKGGLYVGLWWKENREARADSAKRPENEWKGQLCSETRWKGNGKGAARLWKSAQKQHPHPQGFSTNTPQ
ncbi:hypothetical protein D7322_12575 [Sphingobacterium puteale]|uniref:Uncharacterized protein n=1 Tax=Sphingobacterium puteale TaxID=2420510 RepID=A0A420VZ32_9SPHI|nr:hypothetical protein [Sphingobacterium puteale]RKO71582.1 hypothetical protein D7322_12575 [Sphingobacterium puteale]